MPSIQANVAAEYVKNGQLRKEDVTALQQWAEKQPHLPIMSELHTILFLQSCYFSLERAKSTIDTFYTVKKHCPEFFANRDPCLQSAKEFMDVCVYAPLPKSTPDNYRVLYCQLMDGDANKLVFNEQLKSFDMNIMLWLMQEGTQDGLAVLVNMDKTNFGHLTRLSVMAMKKILYYVQEAVPVRLRAVHFINVVPFIDKLLALMKPFMKKELMDIMHFHTDSIESLYKFIPKECLPKDFGGTADSVSDLHESMKKRLIENADYFKSEELLVADESKRPGKPKNAGDLFGVEGTFKKLDID